MRGRERAFYYSLDGVEGRKLFCCFVPEWNSYLLHSWRAMPFVLRIKREVEKTERVPLCTSEAYVSMLLQSWVCVNMSMAPDSKYRP